MGLSDLVIGHRIFFSRKKLPVLHKLFQDHIIKPSGSALQHFKMGWPHSCFYFQEVNVFQRSDKESGCGWKFPLLHDWPKWKQSAHSRWTLWFPLSIPQTRQVWGHIIPLHIGSVVVDGLLDISEREQVTMLLTCSCQFCMMFFAWGKSSSTRT